MSPGSLAQVDYANGTCSVTFDTGPSLVAELGCSKSRSSNDYPQASNLQIRCRRNMFLARKRYASQPPNRSYVFTGRRRLPCQNDSLKRDGPSVYRRPMRTVIGSFTSSPTLPPVITLLQPPRSAPDFNACERKARGTAQTNLRRARRAICLGADRKPSSCLGGQNGKR